MVKKINNRKVERILAISSLVLIVIAGVFGVRREADELTDFLTGIVPEGYRAEYMGDERYALYNTTDPDPEAYLINETMPGYGGDMLVTVLVDTTGTIGDIKVSKHRETPSFLEKTEKRGMRKSLIGKSYDEPFEVGEDVDVVSGATYTSDAMIQSARMGSGRIARDQLKLEVIALEPPGIKVGVPEISLIVLYLLALFGIYRTTRYKKLIRWTTMLGGMFVLGFWLAVPLTLSKINAFLLGYFPDWHTQLYWYLLLGTFVLSILLSGKNIYCNWICPLGAMQECLGAVGGAKSRFSGRFNLIMKWVQRGVALLAILLALYFRNPVKLNYEIFGVALSLTGSTFLFVMTGLFLMASLFIKRPWCTYLCPMVPLEDLLRRITP